MLPNNAPDAHKTRRRNIIKRILLVCVLLAAAGLALLAGLNLYVVSSAKPYILTESEASELEDVDCIIVLGALVYSDGTMSDVLRHRVEMGTALFEAGVSDRILMSGDHSRPGYDEVGTMKDYAVAAGVDPDCVFKDHAGWTPTRPCTARRKSFRPKRSSSSRRRSTSRARSIWRARWGWRPTASPATAANTRTRCATNCAKRSRG